MILFTSLWTFAHGLVSVPGAVWTPRRTPCAAIHRYNELPIPLVSTPYSPQPSPSRTVASLELMSCIDVPPTGFRRFRSCHQVLTKSLERLPNLIEALERPDALNPVTFTDCVLYVGVAMDFPLHREDLIHVDRRYDPLPHTQIVGLTGNSVYLALEE